MMIGKGHPLPASDEARHNEIPERAEQEKGRGDDSAPAVQPDVTVTPDGKPYRNVKGRDDGAVSPAEEDLEEDQAAHQDRGQSIAESERD